MDGVSAPRGVNAVAFNDAATSIAFSIRLYIYYLAAAGNSKGQVLVSNLRLVEVVAKEVSQHQLRRPDTSSRTTKT